MSARGPSLAVLSSLWVKETSSEEQRAARFHWESDRRRLRAMGAALVAASCLVALVLGMVGLRVQQVRLSYRLDALRTARAELEEARGHLRVELLTLRSLARIETRARAELGMAPPTRDQVRLAREFVAGRESVAAGLERQTVVAERPAAADAR
jgi:cell division protein FtsL